MSDRSLNGHAPAGGTADLSLDVGAVVRRLPRRGNRAAPRRCSRPGCESPAAATLTFSYVEREVWLAELATDDDPEAYDLCERHAARTGAPSGWRLTDHRAREDTDDPGRPPGFQTVHTAGIETAGIEAEDPERPATDDPDGGGPARAW
ncbi:MAG: DUF3499 family protein [Nitriliruptorales bacterium]